MILHRYRRVQINGLTNGRRAYGELDYGQTIATPKIVPQSKRPEMPYFKFLAEMRRA